MFLFILIATKYNKIATCIEQVLVRNKWTQNEKAPFGPYSSVQNHSVTEVLLERPTSSLVGFLNWSLCNHGDTPYI